jgi:predicted phosphoadenosine phosphosulfate sulfurtransferase
MTIKEYQDYNVLVAARQRVKQVFDDFETIYVSFSGGKDSTVMLHLVMEEAIKRDRIVGVLIIDLEAQYADTIKHIENMVELYKANIDLHWVCLPMLLRNAVSNFEPRWCCWDEDKKDIWVREKPKQASTVNYPFFIDKMEFEEFMVLWGEWYSEGSLTAAFIGIRADESLHRYCAIARNKTGLTFKNYKWTTLVSGRLYNIYPIYDWRTEDIWIFHGKYSHLTHNKIYDKMNMAGVKLSQQRLCQPYGDDQRRGLWLYHILEPETWYKVVARVNGANSGSLYIHENGNINGYNRITKPEGHTWESFCNLLLKTLPTKTQNHYKVRFKKFISGWRDRGYTKIPDESPIELENKCWAPSWRRMCKVILRNDYWCKSLGQTQPKSDAYIQFKEIKKKRGMAKDLDKEVTKAVELFS